MRRIAAGIIAVLLLGAAGILTWQDAGSHELAATLARVGIVMGALWLALPKADKPVNWWLVALGLVVALGFARLPRSIKLVAIGSLPILAALVWPFRKRKSDLK